MTGGVLLVAAVLGLLGVRAVKKGTPPVPEQAIEEAKLHVRGAERQQWPALTGARRSRSAATSRPSASAWPTRSTTCARRWTSTRSCEAKLPLAAAAALGAGFVVSGGIGATMRLLMRRSREGKTKARFGPFSLVDRD